MGPLSLPSPLKAQAALLRSLQLPTPNCAPTGVSRAQRPSAQHLGQPGGAGEEGQDLRRKLQESTKGELLDHSLSPCWVQGTEILWDKLRDGCRHEGGGVGVFIMESLSWLPY